MSTTTTTTTNLQITRHAIESALVNSPDLFSLPVLPGVKSNLEFRQWQASAGWFSENQLATASTNAYNAFVAISTQIDESLESSKDLTNLYIQKNQLSMLEGVLNLFTI